MSALPPCEHAAGSPTGPLWTKSVHLRGVPIRLSDRVRRPLHVADRVLGIRFEYVVNVGEERRHGGSLQVTEFLEAEVVPAASQCTQLARV